MVKKAKTGDDSSDSNDEEAPSKHKKLNIQSDTDVLKQLYDDGKGGLDKTEMFLRNYIFSQGWKEDKNDNYKSYQEANAKIDQEDADRESEMDKFEQQYNFRFEEKNSAYLTTHAREAPEDSMRRVDDKRKQ